MDETFLENQLNEINKAWEGIKDRGNKDLESKLQIIRSFILSLMHPEEFNDIQREDLRKLAKELNYDATTEFSKWWQLNQTIVSNGVE